ncbi:RNA/RNP complex-1-interacting phosphatase isoform X2 [Cryptotermes secundus]|nr:RNA/RNP complex-1-interacting phosphatase isoform X2 [Cryptotermes secundus]
MGEPIPGTRFISFKVPLKHTLCKSLHDSERFTPEMLMEQCPKLGLVVDLTNTSRYYNGEVFKSKGIQYKKIYCPGQVVPADSILKEFFSTVDAFLNESVEHDSLVGVHCTHGLNRTGYFICRYLNLRMGFHPLEAISAFETARGHKIERRPYIQDIVSGRSVEQMSTQLYQKLFGSDRPRRRREVPYFRADQSSECYREHHPGSSQLPALPKIRHASFVFESPLASLYNDDVSNRNSRRNGPSKSDQTFKRHEWRSHRWDSPTQRDGNGKNHILGRQPSYKSQTRNESGFEAPRDRGQFHSSSTHRNGSNKIYECREPKAFSGNDGRKGRHGKYGGRKRSESGVINE